MKRAIESRPSVGATATVVLRRAVTLPGVASSMTVIVIVRRGALELGRNGQKCRIGEMQAIAVPAGMAFNFRYLPDDNSRFVAQWLIPYLAAEPCNAPVNDIKATDWLARPVDVADPQLQQMINRAIASIKEPDGAPNMAAVHHMQEALLWIGAKGGDRPRGAEQLGFFPRLAHYGVGAHARLASLRGRRSHGRVPISTSWKPLPGGDHVCAHSS